MSPLVEVQQVSAGYPGRPDTVKAVSFAVGPGELWALLGPNGAGKSTLVRAVLGLLPARGVIRLSGKSWGADSAALRREVAWVPQVPSESAEFSALELVLMGRAPHQSAWALPSAADVASADAALAQLGVSHLRDRPVQQASGGERRLVWLARAFVQSPKVLVLDEPTAFLDIAFQQRVLHAVKEWVDQVPGRAVLAVLHDVNHAVAFATHAALLKDGALISQGPVEATLTAPALSALYGVALQAAEFNGQPHFLPMPGAR